MEKIRIWVIFSFIVLVSCDPGEEDAVQLTDMVLTTIDRGDNYNKQIWYSFETDEIVGEANKMDWDLEIGNAYQQHAIYLNSSRFMRAAVTDLVKVSEVYSGQPNLQIDHNFGHLDSLAIGDPTLAVGKVYHLDLGRDDDGRVIGNMLLKINDFNSSTLNISWRDMDSTTVHNAEIALDQNQHIFYSLMQNQIMQGAPSITSWDVCFTQYSFRFYNPQLDYLVYGLLTNNQNVSVAFDDTRIFDSIDLATIDSLEFNQVRDQIGYDWKTYNLQDEEYILHSEMNYILRNQYGRYFKFRFLDFYNAQGERGYPTFEWQLIN